MHDGCAERKQDQPTENKPGLLIQSLLDSRRGSAITCVLAETQGQAEEGEASESGRGKASGALCLKVCWPREAIGGFIRNEVSHPIDRGAYFAFPHQSKLEARAKIREAVSC